jgi:hypothetical protein
LSDKGARTSVKEGAGAGESAQQARPLRSRAPQARRGRRARDEHGAGRLSGAARTIASPSACIPEDTSAAHPGDNPAAHSRGHPAHSRDNPVAHSREEDAQHKAHSFGAYAAHPGDARRSQDDAQGIQQGTRGASWGHAQSIMGAPSESWGTDASRGHAAPQ